jgi:hypothetical protein
MALNDEMRRNVKQCIRKAQSVKNADQTGTDKASATNKRMSSVRALQFCGLFEILVQTSPCRGSA